MLVVRLVSIFGGLIEEERRDSKVAEATVMGEYLLNYWTDVK